MLVVGGDRRVRAVPFGLRGKPVDQQTAQEPADHWYKKQKPRVERGVNDGTHGNFTSPSGPAA